MDKDPKALFSLVGEAEAMRAMTQLEQEATEERIPEGSLIIETPLLEKGGIRSHDLVGDFSSA